MKQLLSRRFFIRGITVAACSFLGGAYFYRVYRWGDRHRFIADIISQRLSYLNLRQADIDKFSVDFLKIYGRRYDRMLSAARFSLLPYEDSPSRVGALNQNIVDIFLKSSSLWVKPFDEMKEVRYVRLFNPFLMPCVNPLAQVE